MLISCLVDFIGLVGWRLVPARSQTDPEGFDTGSYLTEARATEDNKAAGMRLREIEAALAERALYIPDRGKAITAGLILGLTVTVVAFGLLPAAVAFIAGVLASMVLRTVPEVYEAVDWPVLVLLGALIPVAAGASVLFSCRSDTRTTR